MHKLHKHTKASCGAKDLVKLSNHLYRVHNITSKNERKRLLQKAKEVAKFYFVTNNILAIIWHVSSQNWLIEMDTTVVIIYMIM